MPRPKGVPDEQEDGVSSQAPAGASMADRIAAFQMLDGMRDASLAQKCLRLSLVGFTNADIAEMLQMTTGSVAQSLYMERRKPRTSRTAKK